MAICYRIASLCRTGPVGFVGDHEDEQEMQTFAVALI